MRLDSGVGEDLIVVVPIVKRFDHVHRRFQRLHATEEGSWLNDFDVLMQQLWQVQLFGADDPLLLLLDGRMLRFVHMEGRVKEGFGLSDV